MRAFAARSSPSLAAEAGDLDTSIDAGEADPAVGNLELFDHSRYLEVTEEIEPPRPGRVEDADHGRLTGARIGVTEEYKPPARVSERRLVDRRGCCDGCLQRAACGRVEEPQRSADRKGRQTATVATASQLHGGLATEVNLRQPFPLDSRPGIDSKHRSIRHPDEQPHRRGPKADT